MKRIINDFDNFNMNEGKITDFIKNALKKIKDKFKNGAWEEMLKFLVKNDALPNGVEYYSPELVTEAVDLYHADDNIDNVYAKEFSESIEDAYYFKLERNKQSAVFVWGAPGIGKTDIINQVAEKLGLQVITFHLSQIEPSDFRGIPTIEKIDDGEERTVFKLPSIFPTDNGSNDKGGILFFDELNRAPKMVLSAALPLCLEGKVGDYELPSKWIVVAAGNRKEDIGFDATEIEPALANRFQHINYVPTIEAWTNWANDKKYIDPRLIAFLNMKGNQEYFHKLGEDDEASMAWPSPRSWSIASDLVYVKSRHSFKMDLERMNKIYSRSVGKEAASAFINYLKLIEIVSERDIEELYKTGKIKKNISKLRADKRFAVLSAIAFFKKGTQIKPEELKNIYKFGLEQLDSFEDKTTFFAALKKAHTINGEYYIRTKSPWREIYDEMSIEWQKELKEIMNTTN